MIIKGGTKMIKKLTRRNALRGLVAAGMLVTSTMPSCGILQI